MPTTGSGSHAPAAGARVSMGVAHLTIVEPPTPRGPRAFEIPTTNLGPTSASHVHTPRSSGGHASAAGGGGTPTSTTTDLWRDWHAGAQAPPPSGGKGTSQGGGSAADDDEWYPSQWDEYGRRWSHGDERYGSPYGQLAGKSGKAKGKGKGDKGKSWKGDKGKGKKGKYPPWMSPDAVWWANMAWWHSGWEGAWSARPEHQEVHQESLSLPLVFMCCALAFIGGMVCALLLRRFFSGGASAAVCGDHVPAPAGLVHAVAHTPSVGLDRPTTRDVATQTWRFDMWRENKHTLEQLGEFFHVTYWYRLRKPQLIAALERHLDERGWPETVVPADGPIQRRD